MQKNNISVGTLDYLSGLVATITTALIEDYRSEEYNGRPDEDIVLRRVGDDVPGLGRITRAAFETALDEAGHKPEGLVALLAVYGAAGDWQGDARRVDVYGICAEPESTKLCSVSYVTSGRWQEGLKSTYLERVRVAAQKYHELWVRKQRQLGAERVVVRDAAQRAKAAAAPPAAEQASAPPSVAAPVT